jgi:hypothetical protein
MKFFDSAAASAAALFLRPSAVVCGLLLASIAVKQLLPL